MKALLVAVLGALLSFPASTWSEPPAPAAKAPDPILQAYDVQYKGPGRERMIAILKAQVGKPLTDNVMEAVIREVGRSDVSIPSLRIFGEPVEGGVKVTIPEVMRPEREPAPRRAK